MAYLELDSLCKSYGARQVVRNVSLAIEEGSLVTLLGPSGSGKTTILRMIAGLERPDRGRIYLNGEDITRLPVNRRGIGMVFQSYALFPNMTVFDNIAYGLRIARHSKRAIEERVNKLLELVGLAHVRNSYPHQLSGGEQQRTALARALAPEPRILLLDEPLSALDAKIRLSLREQIRGLQEQLGVTTLYVTHDQEEALSISKVVVVMREGQVVQCGDPASVYNKPADRFVAEFIGSFNFVEGRIIDAERRRVQLGNGRVVELAVPVGGTISSVRLAVRPQNIHFVSPGESIEANTIVGRVARHTFLGNIIRMGVQDGGFEWTVDLFNANSVPIPKIGEEVCLFIAPESWVILN